MRPDTIDQRRLRLVPHTLRKFAFTSYGFARTAGEHLHPLSRGFRALIFIVYGFAKAVSFNSTAESMVNAGVPAAKVFLTISIAIELIGGFALLLGYQTRLIALGLTIYLIPVTLVMHALQMFDQGQFVQQQMVQVLKNFAIIGGLMKFMSDGPGAYSIDVKAYRSLVVDGPVLEIPIQRMSLQFNPNILQPLGSLGTVYPDLKINDEWGDLEVSQCALINPTFSVIYVPAPINPTERTIQGQGWTLDLKPGWTVTPKGEGDWVLVPSSESTAPGLPQRAIISHDEPDQ